MQTDIEHINNDNTGIYSIQLQRWIKPKMILVAYLADSPERHTLCGLTRGNGNYTLRWACVFDKQHILSSLPSCEKWLNKLLKGNMTTDIICKKCLNWDVSDVSHKLTYFPPPEFYPSDTGDVTRGKIKTKIVSFSNLKECCRLTHEKVESGCWSEKNAEVYLTVHGINPELRVSIIERAMEIRRGSGDTSTMQLKMKELPPVWDFSGGIECFPDVPMHLLFLNVQKSTVNLVLDWCTFVNNDRKKLMCSFVEIFEYIFELKLEWCKILPIGSCTFGGWVSENWMGFGRVMKWALSTILNMKSYKDLQKEMDELPQSKWTKKMN